MNTSYHRYGLSDTTPSLAILKLYRKLGGEIITIGSDSHKPEHLGTYIKEGKEYVKELVLRNMRETLSLPILKSPLARGGRCPETITLLVRCRAAGCTVTNIIHSFLVGLRFPCYNNSSLL